MDELVNPLVSIIIPVYNTASYLPRCLESVINQDYENLDIICVNDGSTDRSREILLEYAGRDPRIRLIEHEENLGLQEAWRTGVKNALGRYIEFIDSDDCIDMGLCSTAVRHILEKGVDFLQFSAKRINTENEDKTTIYPPAVGTLKGDDILRHFFVDRKEPTAIWMKLYRIDLVKRAFRKIPTMTEYVPGEDILIAFIISYLAESYASVYTEPKYNYYFGRGISSNKVMPLSKFSKYCAMSRYPAIAETFLRNEKADKLAFFSLERMTLRYIEDCWKYSKMVAENNQEAAAVLLQESWGGNPVFEAFYAEKIKDKKI